MYGAGMRCKAILKILVGLRELAHTDPDAATHWERIKREHGALPLVAEALRTNTERNAA